jgi:endogenous inhibitor of DNA gyrase (YacG/DUF329 family)
MQSLLVKCPNCGKEVSKPDKTLKNGTFCIDAYTAIIVNTILR